MSRLPKGTKGKPYGPRSPQGYIVGKKQYLSDAGHDWVKNHRQLIMRIAAHPDQKAVTDTMAKMVDAKKEGLL